MRKLRIYTYSPTGIEAFERCRRQWHLNRGKDITTGDLALGIFMHQKVSSLRVNPRYKSAAKWASACMGYWKFRVIGEGKIRGQTISWKTIEKPEDEKWILLSRIERICLDNFDRLMAEDLPVFFPGGKKGKKVEYKVKPFQFEGRSYQGEIDEIRIDPETGLPVIRDYKTGFRGYLEKRLALKYQPTFYAFFICHLAYTDPDFRAHLHIPDEIARTWAGHPTYVDPRVKTQYYMFEKPKVKGSNGEFLMQNGEYVYENLDPRMETSRSDKDYFELVEKIDLFTKERIIIEETGDYPVTRDLHCNWCRFNQKECDAMSLSYPTRPRQTFLIPLEQQFLLAYGRKVDLFEPQRPKKESTDPLPIQLTFDFLRKKRTKKKTQPS